ncbi:MAG TPA: carboxymuconolactone decarboxylase family protein [Holophagaceae bacterium]|nr:carboxymuconolactone decarboxylase family protein [Holophagaceae bacterium]
MRLSKPHPELAPEPYQILLQMYRYTRACGLESGLVHLVEMRVSQLNGCAFCLDMHGTEALKEGEDPRRLGLVAAWRDAPCFSARERAAFAWAEALTRVGRHEISPELVTATRQHFEEKALVDLTHVITLMNTWNRLGVAFLPALPAFEVRA